MKNSTSDLLIANCDEFIYYDDLVRERTGGAQKKESRGEERRRQSGQACTRSRREGRQREGRRPVRAATQAGESVIDTVEGLLRERGEAVWGSMAKQTLKRKKPNFNETYHGYHSFNQLLEDAKEKAC